MHRDAIRIANHMVGDGHPVFIIAEIGINHNGSVDLAKKLIDGAVLAGCDAVKFQKRTPELCVPRDQWDIERNTPWGRMTYIDYRYRMEFTEAEYAEIDRHCLDRGILWFASCWDEPSVDFMEKFDIPCYKAASASLTDLPLLHRMAQTEKPLILSVGMSTMQEVEQTIASLNKQDLLVAQSTSSYPCRVDHLNLRVVKTLKEKFPHYPIGYSGHETGLAPTTAVVAMGATFVERHITLDRAMWGSDQAASVELVGLMKLVSNIRDVEMALGDGNKCVYDAELSALQKLRRVPGPLTTH